MRSAASERSRADAVPVVERLERGQVSSAIAPCPRQRHGGIRCGRKYPADDEKTPVVLDRICRDSPLPLGETKRLVRMIGLEQ